MTVGHIGRAGRHAERRAEPEVIGPMARRERINHCAARFGAAILPCSAHTKTFVIQTAGCADGRDGVAERMPPTSGREQWSPAGKRAAGHYEFHGDCESGSSERQPGVAGSSGADFERGAAHRVGGGAVPVRRWKQAGGGAHGFARHGTEADGRSVEEHC